jgi:hypothetical protein
MAPAPFDLRRLALICAYYEVTDLHSFADFAVYDCA